MFILLQKKNAVHTTFTRQKIIEGENQDIEYLFKHRCELNPQLKNS